MLAELLDAEGNPRWTPRVKKAFAELVQALESRYLLEARAVTLCDTMLRRMTGNPKLQRSDDLETAMKRVLGMLLSMPEKDALHNARVCLGIAGMEDCFQRTEALDRAGWRQWKSFTVPGHLAARFVRTGDAIVGKRVFMPRTNGNAIARELLDKPVIVVFDEQMPGSQPGDSPFRSWSIHRPKRFTRGGMVIWPWSRSRAQSVSPQLPRSQLACLYRIVEVCRPSHEDSRKDRAFVCAMARCGFEVEAPR